MRGSLSPSQARSTGRGLTLQPGSSERSKKKSGRSRRRELALGRRYAEQDRKRQQEVLK
jgi:hypothetical protein